MKLTMVAILALSLATIADAAAPKASEGSNPGFYRFKVGDFEVNTISDGTYARDVSQFLANITPRELDAALKKNFLTKEIETSLDAFLINTGEKLILVDTGIGRGSSLVAI